ARGLAAGRLRPPAEAGGWVGARASGRPGQTLYFDGFRAEPSMGVVGAADGEDAEPAALRARGGDFALDAAVNRRRREVPTASFGTVFDPAHAGAGEVEETLDQRAYVEGRFRHAFGGARLP